MAGSTLGSIRIVGAGKEYTRLLTRISIWAHGKKINFQEMASMCMKRDKNIRENSLMERSTVRASTTTTAEQFLKGSGTRIESMDLVSSPMPTPKNTREIGLMEKNTVKEPTIIKMEISISEIGSRTKKMDMGCLSMSVEQSMMERGSTTRPPTRDRFCTPIKINTKEFF